MSTDMDYQPVTSNDVIEQVLATVSDEPEVTPAEPTITLPVDTEFDLPGGYISPVGEVALTAEVRELTGRDEELIAKASTTAKALDAVLTQGLVKVGDEAPNDIVRNNLLAGDRDYILLRTYIATFGRDLSVGRVCASCASEVEVKVDLLNDVPIKTLESPGDRAFTVECGVGEVAVHLPTGHTQKALMASSADKTLAELSTLLLENTVVGVNGRPTMGKSTVLDLSIKDRRKINDEIARRNPGPQMQDIKVPCPTCESELEVPLTVAALFQIQ